MSTRALRATLHSNALVKVTGSVLAGPRLCYIGVTSLSNEIYIQRLGNKVRWRPSELKEIPLETQTWEMVEWLSYTCPRDLLLTHILKSNRTHHRPSTMCSRKLNLEAHLSPRSLTKSVFGLWAHGLRLYALCPNTADRKMTWSCNGWSGTKLRNVVSE